MNKARYTVTSDGLRSVVHRHGPSGDYPIVRGTSPGLARQVADAERRTNTSRRRKRKGTEAKD
jgi:hypothetical protein